MTSFIWILPTLPRQKKSRRPIFEFLPPGFSFSFFLSFSLFVYHLYNISMLRGFGFVQGYIFQLSYRRDFVSFSLSFVLAVSFSLLYTNNYLYSLAKNYVCNIVMCALLLIDAQKSFLSLFLSFSNK